MNQQLRGVVNPATVDKDVNHVVDSLLDHYSVSDPKNTPAAPNERAERQQG